MTDEGHDLRPDDWDQFIGQEKVKNELDIRIEAARVDNRPLPHVLLATNPGYGKTTLAQLIATKLTDPFHSFVSPVQPRRLAAFFQSEWDGGVLFLDEIHRFSKADQENLLSLLEDGFFQLSDGRRIPVDWLTVIGATTEPHAVIPPLYDRFKVRPQFEDYDDAEMTLVVRGLAQRIGVSLNDDYCVALGRGSGGVPRIAQNLVLAARDLHQANADFSIKSILDLAGMDPDGLSNQHIEYLKLLAELGGQAGLSPISNMLRLHPSIVQNLEILLQKRNLILFGDRGRQLTQLGFKKVRPNTVVHRRRAA